MTFRPDGGEVKKKYYELSRKYHPDRFTLADAATRDEALRTSALNNEAYRVLTDTDATMAYVLKLHGLLEEEEKYTLPPAFLMEMMDLNEAVSDYEMEPANESLKQAAEGTLASQLAEWAGEVAPLVAAYGTEAADKALLERLKDYYFRKKYLLRIKERIDSFAAR
ncbi:MAG: DnaJ domain-containing protein [Flavipsychrobacter sp.]|nr:DnaJ domain-containing protein [Flavipsychrobacter sp.]